MTNVISLRREPLEGLSGPGNSAVLLEALPPVPRFVLRARPQARLAAAAPLGMDLPTQPCRASTWGERACLWLGPDEWLLLSPDAPALAAALAGLPHALVDVSHRQSAFRIKGSRAEATLAAGCPLDLDVAAFPVGMCTRTVLGKCQIVLWRTAAGAFHVEAWRSFLPYAWAFLSEAAREHSG
jgi:sarcosine oxidase subunit gamma